MVPDPDVLSAIADEVFLNFGAQEIAYIKTVDIEGRSAAGIYSADGRQIATAPTIAIAQAMVRRYDLEPTLVH